MENFKKHASKLKKALSVAGVVLATLNLGCEINDQTQTPIAAASAGVKSRLDEVYNGGVPPKEKKSPKIPQPKIPQLDDDTFKPEVENYPGIVLVGFTRNGFSDDVEKVKEYIKTIEQKIAAKYKIKVVNCNEGL